MFCVGMMAGCLMYRVSACLLLWCVCVCIHYCMVCVVCEELCALFGFNVMTSIHTSVLPPPAHSTPTRTFYPHTHTHPTHNPTHTQHTLPTQHNTHSPHTHPQVWFPLTSSAYQIHGNPLLHSLLPSPSTDSPLQCDKPVHLGGLS